MLIGQASTPGSSTLAWRCVRLVRPEPPSAAGTRWPGRSLRIADRLAHGQLRVAGEIRGCHPRARMFPIMAATSSISALSSSSASSAAASVASAVPYCRWVALSRIARRMASGLLSRWLPAAPVPEESRYLARPDRTRMAPSALNVGPDRSRFCTTAFWPGLTCQSGRWAGGGNRTLMTSLEG